MIPILHPPYMACFPCNNFAFSLGQCALKNIMTGLFIGTPAHVLTPFFKRGCVVRSVYTQPYYSGSLGTNDTYVNSVVQTVLSEFCYVLTGFGNAICWEAPSFIKSLENRWSIPLPFYTFLSSP